MSNFTDHDTFIFDLDDTLWDGYWAKMLVGDFIKTGEHSVVDELGNRLTFKNGVIDFLKSKSENHDLGFVSRGGLLHINKQSQPSIKILEAFDVLKYFNYCQHIIYKTESKGDYIVPSGKTLYIDDNENDLRDVKNKHGNAIDVVNANEFSF